MSKVKRFIKTALVYLAGNVLSKMVAFFLLPLYTSHIIPEQYGRYDLVLSLINLIAPIAFFQIWDGMFRYSFDYKENKEKYIIINNAMCISAAGVIFYFAMFSCVNLYFGFEYFGYATVYGLMFAIQYLYTYAARIFLKNSLFVFSGTINTLVTAVINIILIVNFQWDVKSLYVAPAIGCFIQIFIIECNLHLVSNFRLKDMCKDTVKKMVEFSVPLCVATISYWLLSGFTKVIITGMLGAYENGLYAVANRFGSMITILVTVFQYAWNEIAYLMANDDNRISSYNLCVDILLKTITVGSVAVCLFIKLIFPYFIAEQYYESIYIMPAVIIGVAMNSMAGMLGTLFMTEKKTKFILTSTLVSAMINIVVGLFMTKTIGLQGSVISLAVAFTVLMLLRLIQLRRRFKLIIDKKNVLLVFPMILGIVIYYMSENTILIVVSILVLVALWCIVNKKYIQTIFIELIKKRNANENN